MSAATATISTGFNAASSLLSPFSLGLLVTGGLTAAGGLTKENIFNKENLVRNVAIAFGVVVAVSAFAPALLGLKTAAAAKVAAAKVPTMAGGPWDQLLDPLSLAESGGNPDIAFGGRIPLIQGKTLSNSTLAQVVDWQRTTVKPVIDGVTGTNTAGLFAWQPDTIIGNALQLHMPLDTTMFSIENQRLMAINEFKNAGIGSYLQGHAGEQAIMGTSSKVWSVIPRDMSGLSYYGGVGVNPLKAAMSPERYIMALKAFKAAALNHPDPTFATALLAR